jgi:hypothetical protein
MLQAQFQSVQKPVPSSSSSVPMATKIDHKFSNRIINHGGPKRDTSIQAATRKKQQDVKQYKKNFEVMEKVKGDFDNEMNKIEQLELEMKNQQKFMAEKILKWYSAVTIQCFQRRRMAKMQLKMLKAKRFVHQWLCFRVHFRRKVRAYKKLVKFFTVRMLLRHVLKFLHRRRAQRKVFKYLYLFHLRVRSMKRVALMRKVRETHKHIMLFGERKAYSYLLTPFQPNPIVKALQKFMLNCIYRRRLQM